MSSYAPLHLDQGDSRPLHIEQETSPSSSSQQQARLIFPEQALPRHRVLFLVACTVISLVLTLLFRAHRHEDVDEMEATPLQLRCGSTIVNVQGILPSFFPSFLPFDHDRYFRLLSQSLTHSLTQN